MNYRFTAILIILLCLLAIFVRPNKQYMMIEDLYKTTDKLNTHIESMALNKVNIEFLRKQMDKVLTDIEKLKDANREIGYKNGSYSQ